MIYSIYVRPSICKSFCAYYFYFLTFFFFICISQWKSFSYIFSLFLALNSKQSPGLLFSTLLFREYVFLFEETANDGSWSARVCIINTRSINTLMYERIYWNCVHIWNLSKWKRREEKIKTSDKGWQQSKEKNCQTHKS